MFGLRLLVLAVDRLTVQLASQVVRLNEDATIQQEQLRVMHQQTAVMEQVLVMHRQRLEREKSHIIQCEQRYLARLKEAKDLQDLQSIQ